MIASRDDDSATGGPAEDTRGPGGDPVTMTDPERTEITEELNGTDGVRAEAGDATHVDDREGGPARGAWIALMVRRLGPEFRPVARGLLEQLLHKSSPANAELFARSEKTQLTVSSTTCDERKLRSISSSSTPGNMRCKSAKSRGSA